MKILKTDWFFFFLIYNRSYKTDVHYFKWKVIYSLVTWQKRKFNFVMNFSYERFVRHFILIKVSTKLKFIDFSTQSLILTSLKLSLHTIHRHPEGTTQQEHSVKIILFSIFYSKIFFTAKRIKNFEYLPCCEWFSQREIHFDASSLCLYHFWEQSSWTFLLKIDFILFLKWLFDFFILSYRKDC